MNFLRAFLLIITGIVMMIIGVVGCTNATRAGEEVTTTMEAFIPVTGTPTQVQTSDPPANSSNGTGSESTASPTISAAGTPSVDPTIQAAATAVYAYHEVQPGQTLFSIARAYNVSLDALMRSNNILNPNHIYKGQILIIPNTPCDTELAGNACPPQNQSATFTPTASPVPASSDNSQADNRQQAEETAADNGASTANVIITPDHTETRIIQVLVPKNMTLGESVDVVLTFNIEEADGQSGSSNDTPGSTGTPDFEVEFGEVHYYRDYNLFAVARLDSPGFNYSPATDVRRFVRPGEEVVYHWSIQPTEAEDQTFIITLWLEYEPTDPDVPPLLNGLNWSDAFDVEVRQTIFGLTASAERSISLAIGTGGIIPFFLGVLPLLRRKE